VRPGPTRSEVPKCPAFRIGHSGMTDTMTMSMSTVSPSYTTVSRLAAVFTVQPASGCTTHLWASHRPPDTPTSAIAGSPGPCPWGSGPHRQRCRGGVGAQPDAPACSLLLLSSGVAADYLPYRLRARQPRPRCGPATESGAAPGATATATRVDSIGQQSNEPAHPWKVSRYSQCPIFERVRSFTSRCQV
jgi:hypothetical protein